MVRYTPVLAEVVAQIQVLPVVVEVIPVVAEEAGVPVAITVALVVVAVAHTTLEAIKTINLLVIVVMATCVLKNCNYVCKEQLLLLFRNYTNVIDIIVVFF